MTAVLPVGIIEIAERLGVKRATVDQWIQRDLLPPPDWTVGGRPAWNWPAIRRWALETGRAKQEEPVITIAELTTDLGLPATARERVARFAGAFISPADYARAGRLAPRWAGQGLAATFTRDEAEELEAEWHRAARYVEAGAVLPPINEAETDADREELANRYRP